MEKKLQRNEQEKTIAGVCAGLAEYFDVDVTWIRVAFVLAVLAGFSGVLAYLVLWVAVPAKPFTPNFGQYNTDYKVYESAANSGGPISDPSLAEMPYPKKKSGNGTVAIGLLFVIFGAFFLLDEFNFVPYWFEFHKLWPLVFIIPGILMITNAKKKKSWKDEWQEKQQADKQAQDATQQNAEATQQTTIITDENPDKQV